MKFSPSAALCAAVLIAGIAPSFAQSASPEIPNPANPTPANPVATDGSALPSYRHSLMTRRGVPNAVDSFATGR